LAPKARILAIDNQPYFRNLIEGLLSEEGYRVRTAPHGPEAQEILEREGPFHLVLLDLVPPAGEAVDRIAELRERWPGQEVIVLSSEGEIRTVVATLKHGAADYLLKPIGRESLLDSIANTLARREAGVREARLVDENLAFMGRLSLLERALPLHGLTSPVEVGQALLELLCIEARARGGGLWMQESKDNVWRRVAAHGTEVEESAQEGWPSDAEKLRGRLERGRATLGETDPSLEREPVLFVPCVREGTLLALARLTGRRVEAGAPAFDAALIDGCEKVAEIGALAIHKAIHMADLKQRSFKDDLTGLPTRAFINQVTQTEIQKACRYGRRLALLCVTLDGLPQDPSAESLGRIIHAASRALRTTDVLASENSRRFWVLLADTDSFGAVVLKRRLAERLREVLETQGLSASPAIGVTSYPTDGDSVEELSQLAMDRASSERRSIVRELGIDSGSTVAEIEDRLLKRATSLPRTFVVGAAEILIGDLSCCAQDRGLLFLAPGIELAAILEPLKALGEGESTTEVFLASNGDTIPFAPEVTSLALPPGLSPETTWIVRFGEGTPYALVAGPPDAEGARPVYHSADPILVEHVAFRLREEVGFGLEGLACAF